MAHLTSCSLFDATFSLQACKLNDRIALVACLSSALFELTSYLRTLAEAIKLNQTMKAKAQIGYGFLALFSMGAKLLRSRIVIGTSVNLQGGLIQCWNTCLVSCSTSTSYVLAFSRGWHCRYWRCSTISE